MELYNFMVEIHSVLCAMLSFRWKPIVRSLVDYVRCKDLALSVARIAHSRKASNTLIQRPFNVSTRINNTKSAASSDLPLQEPERIGEGCLCR